MRVMFVSHVSKKYGACRSLLTLIDGLLKKEGVKVHVIIPNKGEITEDFENRGIDYSIIPIKSWVSDKNTLLLKKILRFFFNLIISFIVALKAIFWTADIVYTNSSVTPVGAIAAFLSRKPHIWHIREFGEEDYGLAFDFGGKLSMKLIDILSFKIIVISEALRKKYANYISPTKIQRIYNAVYLNRLNDNMNIISNDSYKVNVTNSKIHRIVIVGLINPCKGQIDAVLAVSELLKYGTEVELNIIGDGDPNYVNLLKQTISKNRIGKNVRLLGYMNDIVPILKLADIVLVCSRSEAFGRVTIEAMSAGKPVIGTRSGATPELIKEGFNGLLYEYGNYKELARKIKYLVDEPEKARKMGENGFREATTKFGVAEHINNIFSVIQQAVNKC